MKWFRWEDDDDGTIILINVDLADTINLHVDNDGKRFAVVSIGGKISSTRDPKTIDRLLEVTGSKKFQLEVSWDPSLPS